MTRSWSRTPPPAVREGPVGRFRRAEVASVREGFVTVSVPAEAGTTRELELPCPPEFSPETGQTVTLAMSGAVPMLYPQRIANGAIKFAHLAADTVLALVGDIQAALLVFDARLDAHDTAIDIATATFIAHDTRLDDIEAFIAAHGPP